jgi:hypothetical protein
VLTAAALLTIDLLRDMCVHSFSFIWKVKRGTQRLIDAHCEAAARALRGISYFLTLESIHFFLLFLYSLHPLLLIFRLTFILYFLIQEDSTLFKTRPFEAFFLKVNDLQNKFLSLLFHSLFFSFLAEKEKKFESFLSDI